ncbi:MAG TPA: hypothetical protein VHS99_18330, partial [Chloroflexota bacterium]|nr:hypothetical protein [Chloroflexota bacterium]
MAMGQQRGITRRAWVVAAALAGGALGAACGGARSAGGGEAGSGGAPAGGLRSGVTVSFYHGGQQAEADARAELLKAFQDAYPQLKAEQLYTPHDTGAKLDSLLSAGTPPDIFYVANGADVTTRAARGSLQELAANGGELLDKDNKTCLLNEPPAVEALQFLQDLVFRHRVMPDPPQYSQAGGNLNGFFNGRGAMSTLPPWLGQVRRDMRQR